MDLRQGIDDDRHHGPGGRRARRAGAVGTTGVLLFAGLTTLAGESGASAAAGDSWCASSRPSARQVGALLDRLDAEVVRRSAGTGLSLEAETEKISASQETTKRIWRFQADRTTARSEWSGWSWVEDADSREIPGRRTTLSGPTFVDAKAHRRYDQVSQHADAPLVDRAVLAALPAHDVWLRTSATARRTWPLQGYRAPFATYAERILDDATSASFTCTQKAANYPRVTVVASGSFGTRTLRLDITAGGKPRLLHLNDAGASLTRTVRIGYGTRLATPAPAIAPSRFRAVAVRVLTRQLAADYIEPAARRAVAAGRTRAERVALLRSVAGRGNDALTRDLLTNVKARVTSTRAKISGGVRCTLRYGSAVGTATFTVKGTKVVTTLSLPRLP